jgi:hypothetical protein
MKSHASRDKINKNTISVSLFLKLLCNQFRWLFITQLY